MRASSPLPFVERFQDQLRDVDVLLRPLVPVRKDLADADVPLQLLVHVRRDLADAALLMRLLVPVQQDLGGDVAQLPGALLPRGLSLQGPVCERAPPLPCAPAFRHPYPYEHTPTATSIVNYKPVSRYGFDYKTIALENIWRLSLSSWRLFVLL